MPHWVDRYYSLLCFKTSFIITLKHLCSSTLIHKAHIFDDPVCPVRYIATICNKRRREGSDPSSEDDVGNNRRYTYQDEPVVTLVTKKIFLFPGFAGGIVGTPCDLINVRMQNDIKLAAAGRRKYVVKYSCNY